MIRFRLLFSVLTFLALGYVAFWYWAAAEAEESIDESNADDEFESLKAEIEADLGE